MSQRGHAQTHGLRTPEQPNRTRQQIEASPFTQFTRQLPPITPPRNYGSHGFGPLSPLFSPGVFLNSPNLSFNVGYPDASYARDLATSDAQLASASLAAGTSRSLAPPQASTSGAHLSPSPGFLAHLADLPQPAIPLFVPSPRKSPRLQQKFGTAAGYQGGAQQHDLSPFDRAELHDGTGPSGRTAGAGGYHAWKMAQEQQRQQESRSMRRHSAPLPSGKDGGVRDYFLPAPGTYQDDDAQPGTGTLPLHATQRVSFGSDGDDLARQAQMFLHQPRRPARRKLVPDTFHDNGRSKKHSGGMEAFQSMDVDRHRPGVATTTSLHTTDSLSSLSAVSMDCPNSQQLHAASLAVKQEQPGSFARRLHRDPSLVEYLTAGSFRHGLHQQPACSDGERAPGSLIQINAGPLQPEPAHPRLALTESEALPQPGSHQRQQQPSDMPSPGAYSLGHGDGHAGPFAHFTQRHAAVSRPPCGGLLHPVNAAGGRGDRAASRAASVAAAPPQRVRSGRGCQVGTGPSSSHHRVENLSGQYSSEDRCTTRSETEGDGSSPTADAVFESTGTSSVTKRAPSSRCGAAAAAARSAPSGSRPGACRQRELLLQSVAPSETPPTLALSSDGQDSDAACANDGTKRCNCKRSRCLKLYCDCFAAGMFCGDSCACAACQNNEESRGVVNEKRESILQRNPQAFQKKIQSAEQQHGTAATHVRGCNCKKSRCRKKYCECFQAAVPCGEACRCEGCTNPYGCAPPPSGAQPPAAQAAAHAKEGKGATVRVSMLSPVTPAAPHMDGALLPKLVAAKRPDAKQTNIKLEF